jgi:hypothetical protein
MSPSVFASTFTYAWTKLYGQAWVKAALSADPDAPGASPALRAFGPARMCKHIALTFGAVPVLDIGTTLITKARSQAAGAFLSSGRDVWLSFDDDAVTDGITLESLVECAHDTGGLVAVPCLTRGTKTVAWQLGYPWYPQKVRRMGRHALYPILASSFSVVAIARRAVEECARNVSTCGVGHEAFPALFRENVLGTHWVGEDVGFCLMLQKMGIPVHALLHAPLWHAGRFCSVNEAGDLQTDEETGLEFLREAETRDDLPALGVRACNCGNASTGVHTRGCPALTL